MDSAAVRQGKAAPLSKPDQYEADYSEYASNLDDKHQTSAEDGKLSMAHERDADLRKTTASK